MLKNYYPVTLELFHAHLHLQDLNQYATAGEKYEQEIPEKLQSDHSYRTSTADSDTTHSFDEEGYSYEPGRRDGSHDCLERNDEEEDGDDYEEDYGDEEGEQGPSWPRILGRSDFSLQEN